MWTASAVFQTLSHTLLSYENVWEGLSFNRDVFPPEMIDRSQLPLITLSAVGHKPSHSVLPPEAGNASLSLVILFFKDGTNWLIRDTINSSSRLFPDVLPCFQTEHVEESGVDASPFKRKNAMGFLSPSGFAQHVLLHRKRRVLLHSSKSS